MFLKQIIKARINHILIHFVHLFVKTSHHISGKGGRGVTISLPRWGREGESQYPCLGGEWRGGVTISLPPWGGEGE